MCCGCCCCCCSRVFMAAVATAARHDENHKKTLNRNPVRSVTQTRSKGFAPTESIVTRASQLLTLSISDSRLWFWFRNCVYNSHIPLSGQGPLRNRTLSSVTLLNFGSFPLFADRITVNTQLCAFSAAVAAADRLQHCVHCREPITAQWLASRS